MEYGKNEVAANICSFVLQMKTSCFCVHFQKEDFISGNATLEGMDAYETMNAGKTYGQGFQEGCMQFY